MAAFNIQNDLKKACSQFTQKVVSKFDIFVNDIQNKTKTEM